MRCVTVVHCDNTSVSDSSDLFVRLGCVFLSTEVLLFCVNFHPVLQQWFQASFGLSTVKTTRLAAPCLSRLISGFFTLLIMKLSPFYQALPFFPPFVTLENLHTFISWVKKVIFLTCISPLFAANHVSALFSRTCESDRRGDEKWKRAVD